jgi:hypothetical protein
LRLQRCAAATACWAPPPTPAPACHLTPLQTPHTHTHNTHTARSSSAAARAPLETGAAVPRRAGGRVVGTRGGGRGASPRNSGFLTPQPPQRWLVYSIAAAEVRARASCSLLNRNRRSSAAGRRPAGEARRRRAARCLHNPRARRRGVRAWGPAPPRPLPHRERGRHARAKPPRPGAWARVGLRGVQAESMAHPSTQRQGGELSPPSPRWQLSRSRRKHGRATPAAPAGAAPARALAAR